MMLLNINFGFVWALVKRDLRRYFTNPTGYVFITLFIFLSAVAAFWPDRFFMNNLANLDQLNALFPYLLVFFVPALTMAVWSTEKEQATDELLLTMPATSLEVVLGKFIATLGIYSASLVLSMSHILVLFWLGSPDLGVMFSNYVGYWFIGAAMIAIGMVASLLTANTAIAFILGALLCGFLAFIDSVGTLISSGFGEMLEPLGVVGHFGDFSRGILSVSGILYFVSVTGLMVYVNVLMVQRRHWPKDAEGYPMWAHQTVRLVALVVAVVSFNAIVGRASLRLDVTAEQLHKLSPETYTLINQIPEDRPVFVQAFVSPDVPEPLVQTRANLLSTLSEFDAIGGSKVQVLVEEAEPYTEAARDAREKFGIVPREVPNLGSARSGFSTVFLGVAFTCGAEEQVIPFMDRGLSSEYELARSIRVVARTDRKKIGVLDTEAKIFGGMDFQTFRSTPAWPVVEELKKQYEVQQVPPTAKYPENLDGLLVALPSSLSQEEMAYLLEYASSGKPTLLLVDPLPLVNIGLAPLERSGANQNPFMRNQGPPPKEKGDIQRLLTELGVAWDTSQIIWDSYNPHPDLAHLPPEVVFVGEGNKNDEAFTQDHKASSALQELVLMYPGTLDKAAGSKYRFDPLLRSGANSGRFSFYQLVQRNFFGVQLNQNLAHRPDGADYVLAAHIHSGSGDADGDDAEGGGATDPAGGAQNASDDASESEETVAGDDSPAAERGEPGVNLIVVADLDFISQQFFEIRERGPENLNFDNVTFFLNCMDVLIGDESFISLRNKRIKHRTLERVESQTQEFIEQRVEEEKQAEDEAEKALSEAQGRLDEKVNEVRQRPDLDAQTKQIMARNLQEAENRKFEVLKANIESQKQAKTNSSKEDMEAQIRRIQSNIKTFAVLLPPIPVFFLGVMIFVRRQRREREGSAAARRLRA